MFPSTDVFRAIAFKPFAQIQTTTGVVGKVDKVVELTGDRAILSVSDPVGFIVFEPSDFFDIQSTFVRYLYDDYVLDRER